MADQDTIVSKLQETRVQLQGLKRDRSTFLKSADVQEMFSSLKEQIKLIVSLKPEERTAKVNGVLDDVFQLMSLALLTVGLNRTAPANYASLATLQRLLEHLDEASNYTDADIEPIRQRLKEITSIINKEGEDGGDDFTSPEMLQLIQQKLDHCNELLKKVETEMLTISPQMEPILQKLILLRREILSVGAKPNFHPSQLKPLNENLRKISESVKTDSGTATPNGQATINGLIEKCHTLITDFTASHEQTVDPALKPLYTQLVEVKSTLENLLVTHRWTLRETDLYAYQKKLQEIDDMRVDGKFKVDGTAPRGQNILLYLLRRCYAIIYRLLESSEPVSEALTPIHNQLSTVRQCLLDVKKMGGLSSARELYPYQMKLASIDHLRVDGKFMVGDSIPEGQGMLNALLAECFDICHELKVEMEESSN